MLIGTIGAQRQKARTITRHITLRLLFTLSFCACSSANAVDEQRTQIEIRTIGIPPYGVDQPSNPSGIYYDIANLVVQKAGYQSNNLIYPYARIVSELQSGETDLTIMFKYPYLDKHVIYIAPLPALKTVVIGLKESQLESIESLSGKTLAYLRGAQFSDEIDEDASIVKHVTDDFAQAARMLVFGRVDAVIGPLEPLLRAVEAATDADVLGEPFVVSERTPWIQMSTRSAERLSADSLRAIFEGLERDGEVKRIQRAYLQP
jgi:polar amino acid transport system substrate-binding protein